MGALHDGHLSLIAQARADDRPRRRLAVRQPDPVRRCGRPRRLSPRRGARRPRWRRSRRRRAVRAADGRDLPAGLRHDASASPASPPRWRAQSRGEEHFAGVATVVTKLLNMAQPDAAFFGQKDAQQVAVIRRLVRDLDIPVRIEVGATVREPDGLALSSRNARLRNGERERAAALPHALAAARRAVAARRARPRRRRRRRTRRDARPRRRARVPRARRRPTPSSPFGTSTASPCCVAVAARVGDVRLIDNELLATNGSDPSAPSTGSH